MSPRSALVLARQKLPSLRVLEATEGARSRSGKFLAGSVDAQETGREMIGQGSSWSCCMKLSREIEARNVARHPTAEALLERCVSIMDSRSLKAMLKRLVLVAFFWEVTSSCAGIHVQMMPPWSSPKKYTARPLAMASSPPMFEVLRRSVHKPCGATRAESRSLESFGGGTASLLWWGSISRWCSRASKA